jgi:ribose transport system permease protein
MNKLSSTVKKLGKSSIVSILVFFAIILILFSILSPNFMTGDNLMNVLRQVSMIGIAGCGMIVVLLSGGVDLSIGAMVTFVNITCAALMVNMGINPVLACVIGILLATVLGTINGILIAYCRLMPFITTLCMMYILRGVSFILTNSQPIYGLNESFKFLGQGYILGIPVPVIIMVVLAVCTGIFLRYTYIGRYFYYIGGNEEATKLSGVNTNIIRVLAYTLSGFFTGIAAIVWLSRINSGQPDTGVGFEFDVICALVLGGVSAIGGEGGILGAMIGVFALGFLNNGMTMLNLNEYPQMLVKGIVLLFAIALDMLRHNVRIKKVLHK